MESKSTISSVFLHAGKHLCHEHMNALTVPLVAGTEQFNRAILQKDQRENPLLWKG